MMVARSYNEVQKKLVFFHELAHELLSFRSADHFVEDLCLVGVEVHASHGSVEGDVQADVFKATVCGFELD